MVHEIAVRVNKDQQVEFRLPGQDWGQTCEIGMAPSDRLSLRCSSDESARYFSAYFMKSPGVGPPFKDKQRQFEARGLELQIPTNDAPFRPGVWDVMVAVRANGAVPAGCGLSVQVNADAATA